MADINTLLGMGVRPQDNMEALANKLRGEQQTGQMLGMSTLAPVAQYGQNMASGAADSAKTGGVLRRTMEKENEAKRQFDNTALAKTQAAKKLADVAKAKREELHYYHPTEQGKTLTLERAEDGTYYDQNKQPVDPEMVATLTPLDTRATGSKAPRLSKAEVQKKEQKKEEILSRDFISSRLISPHMAGAVGSKAALGTSFPEWIGINEDVQSLQTDLSGMTVQQASQPLSYLGVNPTDKDLEFALKASRTLDSQPTSWRDWYKDTYAPLIKRYMSESDLSPDEKAAAIADWDATVVNTVNVMNENIKREKGKSGKQRLSETFDESKTIDYENRQKVPEGINPEEWGGLSDEDKDFYLKNMVK